MQQRTTRHNVAQPRGELSKMTTKLRYSGMQRAAWMTAVLLAAAGLSSAQGASDGKASQVETQKRSSVEVPTEVLYGAAYYHEYEPYERLDQDIAMMKKAGLKVVRMGESTWSLWEPEDGTVRIRVDGPRSGCDGQGRDQGHHGDADLFDSDVDVP